jgi:hypothetical protein
MNSPHPCPSPLGRGKKGEGASSSGEDKRRGGIIFGEGKRERGLFQRGSRIDNRQIPNFQFDISKVIPQEKDE